MASLFRQKATADKIGNHFDNICRKERSNFPFDKLCNARDDTKNAISKNQQALIDYGNDCINSKLSKKKKQCFDKVKTKKNVLANAQKTQKKIESTIFTAYKKKHNLSATQKSSKNSNSLRTVGNALLESPKIPTDEDVAEDYAELEKEMRGTSKRRNGRKRRRTKHSRSKRRRSSTKRSRSKRRRSSTKRKRSRSKRRRSSTRRSSTRTKARR